jgi:putative transposase
MTLYKNKFRIESIRLKEYDYSQPGEYFVTICAYNHKCLFGEVVEEEMSLSPIGSIAKEFWEEIPKHFNNIALDAFIVMPNHIHGIIVITDHGRDGRLNVSEDKSTESKIHGRDVARNVSTKKIISPKRGSLGSIIRSYKSAVSNWCHTHKQNDFKWHPRFYEHIIRSEKELQNIRDYIVNNPIKWFSDKENPDQGK